MVNRSFSITYWKTTWTYKLLWITIMLARHYCFTFILGKEFWLVQHSTGFPVGYIKGRFPGQVKVSYTHIQVRFLGVWSQRLVCLLVKMLFLVICSVFYIYFAINSLPDYKTTTKIPQSSAKPKTITLN